MWQGSSRSDTDKIGAHSAAQLGAAVIARKHPLTIAATFTRRRLWHLSLLVLAVCWCSTAVGAVMTDRGPVQGSQHGDLTVYKGLPFAAPPVGKFRWRAPQPVPAWSSVKLLDHFSPRCMQLRMYPDNAPVEPMSEDCLYLNLWVPRHSAGEKLPVMVWIYGGGLDGGSGSTPLYAGDMLARRGVIVVTFNYRLGVFGFLAHPQLAQESPRHTTGNYGLLDQIAALRWVHTNIAAFGGDPTRVTVFGQSSGSISISALSASPMARGLFRNAIGESGGLFEPMQLSPSLTLSGAEQNGKDFAKRAGATSIEALRKISASALLKVPFTPAIIIDGAVIDEPPAKAFRDGRINPSSFMIGSNKDEGAIFLAGKNVTSENYKKVLGRDFPSWLITLAAPPPGKTDATAYNAAKAFEGDMRFHWDMWTWARLATRAGRPVYLYSFVHPTPCAHGAGCTETTRHGDEMPYVFGHDPGTWNAGDHALSRLMVGCWAHFAKTGSPDGCGLPGWRRFGDNAAMMVMGKDPHVSRMQPNRTLRRLDDIYHWAEVIAPHPFVALALLLLALCAIIGALVVLARLCLRGLRARRTQRGAA